MLSLKILSIMLLSTHISSFLTPTLTSRLGLARLSSALTLTSDIDAASGVTRISKLKLGEVKVAGE